MSKSTKYAPAVKHIQRSGIDRRQKTVGFKGPERRHSEDRRGAWSVIHEWRLAVNADDHSGI